MRKIEKRIFDEIKKAKDILMHLHLGPDGDAIGSVFAVWQWLEKLGKKVTVVSFDPIPEEFGFLEEIKRVKKADVAKLDLSKFDLWLCLDSGWEVITKSENFQLPEDLMVINIDHHKTNTKFGKINLVLPDKSSTAEIILDLFESWRVKINKELATRLFVGIFTDTGNFSFRNTKPEVLRKAAKLMDNGADLQLVRFHLQLSRTLKNLKYWSLVLGKMKVNKKYHFAISAFFYKDLQNLGLSEADSPGAIADFSRLVKDTDFGVVLREIQPGEVKGSLRAKGDFDVSKIALAMGGGGHKAAAGFRAKGGLKSVERKLLGVIKKLT